MIHRVRPLFGRITDRDLVFIDQRGTGASELTCPPFPGLDRRKALRTTVGSCLRHLMTTGKGGLADYSTASATDDVAQVLSDLHYDAVNLVGISYGTTVEQTFLMRHPERVRTMTLLSGTLLDVPVFERMPASVQAALDNVFAECDHQPRCHRAFPQLHRDWASVWTSITQHPWVVPANRSPDGQRQTFDEAWLAAGLHQELTIATTQARLPLLVHLLGTTKDRAATLLAIARAVGNQSSATDGNTRMLAYATRCNESWARYDPNRLIGKASFEYGVDRANAQWWRYVCGLIPRARDAMVGPQRGNAKVAVLALNGAEDPQDPPDNMAGASTLWPKSRALVVRGQGHDIDPGSGACDARLIASFIERGTPSGLDTACLATLRAPRFPITLAELTGS